MTIYNVSAYSACELNVRHKLFVRVVYVYRYDNEYGYSHRVVDLINYVFHKDHA